MRWLVSLSTFFRVFVQCTWPCPCLCPSIFFYVMSIPCPCACADFVLLFKGTTSDTRMPYLWALFNIQHLFFCYYNRWITSNTFFCYYNQWITSNVTFVANEQLLATVTAKVKFQLFFLLLIFTGYLSALNMIPALVKLDFWPQM